MVKEQCEKVVDFRRKSDRVMVVVLAFEEQVIRVISAYGPQARRPLQEKHKFYDELAGEYELQNPSEVVFGHGDFNGHVGEEIKGFEGVHGGNGIGKRNGIGFERRVEELVDVETTNLGKSSRDGLLKARKILNKE